MKKELSKCPSCGQNLQIRRLQCPDCDLAIEGGFELHPLMRLSGAQQDFASVFLKNRGVIRDVERELGISYPTVRARLDDLVAALGFASAADSPLQSRAGHRRAILAELKAGRITPDQALDALNEADIPGDPKPGRR